MTCKAWTLAASMGSDGKAQLVEAMTTQGSDQWQVRTFAKSCAPMQQAPKLFRLDRARQSAGDRVVFAGWRKSSKTGNFDLTFVSKDPSGECAYFAHVDLEDPQNNVYPVYEIKDIWVSDPK